MRRSKPLVCEHLENISSKALEEYQDIICDYVRGRRGVYALYRRDKLYYVGLARNLRNRLKQHLKDKHSKSWDRFSVYLTVDDSHLKELESMVLRIVRPKGNKQIGKFAKSTNLKNRLGRDIRQYYRRQVDELLGRRLAKKIIRIPRGPSGQKGSRRAVLKGCFERAMALRASYKGKEYRARILKTGVIRYRNKTYLNPSEAATAAKGRRANGWWFWKFKNPSGEWARLKTLGR